MVAQPEGLPESSRWSESAETTGKVISHDRTPEGCQMSGQRKRSLRRGIWHPPGCEPTNIAFPVVSADSDHRLLSLQPFGFARFDKLKLVGHQTDPLPQVGIRRTTSVRV